MLKASTIAVAVILATGCAPPMRPVGPEDLPARGGVVVEGGDTAEVLPPAEQPALALGDLAPLPLPEGVRADDFDIGLQYNGRVAYWLDYYQKYRSTFDGWLGRMSRYEPLIRRELTDAGLPGDLIYLALIESGFATNATSTARAVGIWQFMKETARLEGLEVSTYVDDRRDPVRATEAAVHHLRSLYRELGSWYLVAAAYNSGSGRVSRALDAVAGGARGADSLFWSIEPVLPGETRDYVPKFLAASILAKYPDLFGLAPDTLPGPDQCDSVRIGQATDLAAIARAARASEDDVRRLNARYYLGVTPPHRTVVVRLPAGHADGVLTRLAEMPRRERIHDVRHTIVAGETLRDVASTFGVELSALRTANHLKKKTRTVAVGRELVIPLASTVKLARSERESTTRTADVGTSGGTSPAGRTAVVDAVDRDQGATPAREAVHRTLASPATYRVRQGDTLWHIARTHGLTVSRLRELNGLGDGDMIHPGETLRVSGGR